MKRLNNLGYRVKNQKENSFDSFRGGIERKRRREKDCKGFTLVELIVVIVILAILAAILIPGLLKWIDKAREKRYEAEASNIYLAVETSLAVGYTREFKGDAGFTLESGNYYRQLTKGNVNSREWLSYIEEMSGINTISWMRCYFTGDELKALSIDYVSPSDNKKLKAWINEIGYTSTDGDYQKWFDEWKQDDGMWHFKQLN